MKQVVFLAVALGALNTSHAQLGDPALQVKVTLDSKFVSLAAALERLEKQSQVPLDVANQLAGEPIFLSISDAPLSDVMARIAKVSGGVWRKEKEQFRLIRPSGLDASELAQERASRLKSLRRQIADMIENLNPKAQGQSKSNGRSFGQGFPFGNGSGSGDRSITKLLGQIDVTQVANLEKGQRVVFSSNPTQMQRSFFGDVSPVIAELVRNHNREAANQQGGTGSADDDVDQEEMAKFLEALGISYKKEAIEGRPAKVLLAISRGGLGFASMMGGYQVSLVLYDTSGKVLISQQSMLMDEDGGMFGAMFSSMASAAGEIGEAMGGENKPQEPKFEGPDAEIAYSAESKEIASIFSSLGAFGRGGGPPLATKRTPELEAVLERPDLHDPLSFAESDSLFSVAKTKKWNIVADIPDSRLNLFSSILGGAAAKVDAYLAQITKDNSVVVGIENGWMTVQPARPRAARLSRFNRASMAKLIAAARNEELIPLDAFAEYALANPAPMESPGALLYLSLYAPGAVSAGMMGMVDWNVLRLYGTLGPAHKAALASGSGAEIPFASMFMQQRQLVEHIVFGSSANLVVGEVPQQSVMSPFLDLMRGFLGSQAKSWKEEPTEIMPTGLPGAGSLKLTVSQSMVARSMEEDEFSQMFGSLGAAELAMLEYFSDMPEMTGAGRPMPQMNSLKLGNRSTYGLIFQVAADVTARRVLNDDRIPKGAQIVSKSNLPEAFRAEIERQKKLLKDDPMIKMMTGMAGRRRSEPPQVH